MPASRIRPHAAAYINRERIVAQRENKEHRSPHTRTRSAIWALQQANGRADGAYRCRANGDKQVSRHGPQRHRGPPGADAGGKGPAGNGAPLADHVPEYRQPGPQPAGNSNGHWVTRHSLMGPQGQDSRRAGAPPVGRVPGLRTGLRRRRDALPRAGRNGGVVGALCRRGLPSSQVPRHG